MRTVIIKITNIVAVISCIVFAAASLITASHVPCLSVPHSSSLRPALSGVTFSVGAGETLGVVGRTGSGKSSLLAALFRMHPVSSGAVFIDDVNVMDVGVETLR